MKLNFILIPSNKPEKEVLSQLTDDLRRELKYASTDRIEEYNQNFPDTKNQCVNLWTQR